MKISYTIRAEDRVMFNIQHLNKSSRIEKIKSKNRIILSILYGVIGLILIIYKPEYWPMTWIMIFLGILWYFFYPIVWKRGMIKKLKKMYTERESWQELEFRPQGIWARSNIRSGEIPKEAIKKIIKNEHYLFLYLNEEDAIIIPRREIEKDFAWEELLSCINEIFGKECEFENSYN